MKTINSLRSKLLALTLALMASVASFAYEFEYVNDFHIDGFAYKVLPSNTLWPYGAVALIEIADCTADVIIPDTITYTFSNTTVTYIVTTLGGGAALFTNSAKETVKSISIPKGISVINSPLFAGCSNLTSIVVDSENHYYDSRENCNAIITTAQNPYFTPNTLIAGCKTTIIPNSVVEIGENAFYDCESLETITIPNSVTKIGKSTFNACSTLSSITLSENLTAIGDWAFDDCNNLKEVICYAPQPPTISKYTFSDISPTIYVPENTVTIYQNAPYWMTFDIQPINAGPFNENLLGTWRVVGGNEIISISDSIIVFKYLGLTQKYTASATQLTVERLWIPEEESFRWANCNYTLSNDTLWIDNFMPLLVATYPPTFGPITLVKVKYEDLFPTLWGLQRTTFYHYTECSDSYSSLTASNEIVTINDKPYLRFGKLFLREANNQVLIYSAAYDKDLVLYDWNLEVGDSISLLAMDYGVYPEYAVSVVDYRVIVDIDENGDLITDTIPTDKVVVDKISTITLLDGKEYKTWHLATGWAGGITYVEGIGILSEGYGGGDYLGLIRPEELPTCYYGDLLVCVSKNNKLLYQMDPVKMDELGAECLCDYDRGPRKDNAKNGKIGGRPTPTQWNMLEVETKEMDGTPTILRAETFSYTLENDSTIANNKTFYQLARQSTKDTAITKSFVGALHFGEDEDNRVYFLRDGVEYVLYDFTAEPGDTIEIFAGINNYPQETTYTHVVTGKDTLENGACRMMLEVVFPDETTTATNAEKVWLAGLGSIDGIVHNAAQRTSDAHAAPSRSASSSEVQTSVMLCAWREDSCLYTTNHPEYDTFGCVYNQDPTTVENLTSPSSYQKIIHEGTLLILHEGKVYNVIGIQIK